MTIVHFLARTLHLQWVSAFPWWAPLEPTSDHPTSARAVVAALSLLAWLAVALLSWRKRARLAAGLCLAVVVALLVASTRLHGAHGPLGRGALWVTPLLWSALVLLAQSLLVEVLPERARTPWFAWIVGLSVAALSLLAAGDRLFGRETQWRAVLARDPGNEIAAIALSDLLVADKRAGEALVVLRSCADARPAACDCVVRASAPDVDASRAASVLPRMDRATQHCATNMSFVALRADALSQVARYAEAIVEADRVLATRPEDPHALYARGIAALAAGDVARALHLGRRAEAAGRGTPARLLIGGAQLFSGDIAGATHTFDAASAADPTSASARYHVGVAAERANKYRDAREAYLHALRLDPAFVDARHALVLLTARNGAKPEAKHHLEKLREIAAGDPRLAALEKVLAEP
jgi:tetratricopeptide (TPR) repeat protein